MTQTTNVRAAYYSRKVFVIDFSLDFIPYTTLQCTTAAEVMIYINLICSNSIAILFASTNHFIAKLLAAICPISAGWSRLI